MPNGQHEAASKNYWMASGMYNALKFLALLLLPTLSSVYFALSGIWGLPYTEQIVGTIAVVDAALGYILKYAKSSFDKSNGGYDGVIDIVPDDGGVRMDMQLLRVQDPLEVQQMDKVVFKVNNKA